MKFIDENPTKFLSVKLPFYGALLVGLLPIILEKSMGNGLIPQEYHAMVVSVILPTLAYIGRSIYQPELHQQEKENEKTHSENSDHA